MATGEIVEPDGFYATLKEKDEELISRAKFPRELLVKVEGIILDVIGRSYSTHAIEGFPIIGGSNSTRETGYRKELQISLRQYGPEGNALENKFPLRLAFRGDSPIFTGDFIKAAIFAGERKDLLFKSDNQRVLEQEYEGMGRVTQYVLVPRDFNEEEQALYIDIIRDGKTVRSDYSVNYDHKFFS